MRAADKVTTSAVDEERRGTPQGDNESMMRDDDVEGHGVLTTCRRWHGMTTTRVAA
jgi:hypothetical protein